MWTVAKAAGEKIREIAMDPDIWRYFVSRVDTDEDFTAFFDAMLADHAAGRRVVFVVTDKRSGRTAGSMSFGNLSEPDRRPEIGRAPRRRALPRPGGQHWAAQ